MRQADKAIIAGLHPAIRQKVIDSLNTANTRLTGRAQVILTSGFRPFQEQQTLYDKGRKTPGPKVTNAKPGQSGHNYRLAVDFCLLIDGKKWAWDDSGDYDGDHVSDWMEVVQVFKEAGFEWGGDWKTFVDKPHFQMLFGYTMRQLLYRVNQGMFIEGTNYVKL